MSGTGKMAQTADGILQGRGPSIKSITAGGNGVHFPVRHGVQIIRPAHKYQIHRRIGIPGKRADIGKDASKTGLVFPYVTGIFHIQETIQRAVLTFQIHPVSACILIHHTFPKGGPGVHIRADGSPIMHGLHFRDRSRSHNLFITGHHQRQNHP